ALDRLTACAFDTAVVTNVTHEHLDFHKTWGNYLAAKAHLLELVQDSMAVKPGRKSVVLNRDDRSYPHLHRRVGVDEVSYGLDAAADVVAEGVQEGPAGVAFMLRTPWGAHAVTTRLVGQFNVYNCLAAA